MMKEYERYAVYYAPAEDSSLGRFGNAWLGWNAESARYLERPDVAGLPTSLIKDVTTSPALYGFHGTLKPPFKLCDGVSVEQLDQAIHDLAKAQSPCLAMKLALDKIGRFLAFTPKGGGDGISNLAGACVRELDVFRAQPTEVELQKRRSKGLTPYQDQLLMQWGYPYVMDAFRFHLTLSNSLEADVLDNLHGALTDYCADIIAQPITIEDICLFGDPGQKQPFHLIKRYRLCG